jgi:hypothetical protein
MMRVVMETRIHLGKVRHFARTVGKSGGGADHRIDEDGHGHHEEFGGRPDMAFPHSPSQHSHRGASRSPVLQRDQQFQFVDSHPAVQASYSSGQGSNGPNLPAGFASIMNAYTEQGSTNQPQAEFVHHTGNGTIGGRTRSRKSAV